MVVYIIFLQEYFFATIRRDRVPNNDTAMQPANLVWPPPTVITSTFYCDRARGVLYSHVYTRFIHMRWYVFVHVVGI